MSGRTWRTWPDLGVGTSRTSCGADTLYRVHVADPDRPYVWRDTGVFVSPNKYERPESRYSVNLSGGHPSGSALTVNRKRTLADAVAAAARLAVQLEKQRAQQALDAAVETYNAHPTDETSAANLAAATRFLHWAQRAISFECIDQQTESA